ncbi:thiamine pyrophosphate-binding protein [Methylobacterium nonmethylotrophicum]|uniref:Uncharacterized protein n=1 Tax=Methylobacterium nonmethylotrophicum TaxID=1141884 RepID=A0A4Z0NN87_9HYPH|nr:thiamine pyrophosphate-binding protein [Methylobacterium nonmethylotrophicum]TGD97038.1 hypothetical protein EU555_21700 [Methylobacterium nonmethylotrophicum]
MRRMTGGAAIVEALAANGVDTVFGLPGAQMYPLFDALKQREAAIRTVGARHEQACGYMAFGYARSTGRPGVYAVVPGPGVLNTTAALCTAYGTGSPVLCLTGQVPTAFLGKGRGHLHELPDQLGTLRSLVKWAERIERVEDAPAVIDEAFRRMLSGRPGPVAVEMAWDVMAGAAEVAPLPASRPDRRPVPCGEAVARAARLLAAAERPMILVGSGAQHAGAAVLALAEALDAPVGAFRGGRGVVDEDHPLGVSSYAARLLWDDTDALVGIGSRLEMPYMRWAGMMRLIDRPETPPLVRLDIDPVEFERLVPEVGILADSEDGARALLAAVRAFPRRDRPDRRAAIAAAKARARSAVEAVQPQVAYLDAIRAVLPRDGFLVPELSQLGFATYFGWPVHEPRTYVSEGYQGTLGFGFPTALGVKVAHPGRAVVSVTGDGGFLFGVQELATAAQERIGLVTVVVNNASYGNVLRDQQTGFGNRIIGSVLENPDFLLLAKAFGVAGAAVSTPDGLAAELRLAFDRPGPTLIEVRVPQGTEASPWPFIHPPARPA